MNKLFAALLMPVTLNLTADHNIVKSAGEDNQAGEKAIGSVLKIQSTL